MKEKITSHPAFVALCVILYFAIIGFCMFQVNKKDADKKYQIIVPSTGFFGGGNSYYTDSVKIENGCVLFDQRRICGDYQIIEKHAK